MKKLLFLTCCILLSCSSQNPRELVNENGGAILQATINYTEFIRGELANPDQDRIQHALSTLKDFKGTPDEFVKKFMDSFEKEYPKLKIVQYMQFGQKDGPTISSSNDEIRKYLISKLNKYLEFDKTTIATRIQFMGTYLGEVIMKDDGIIEIIAPGVSSSQKIGQITAYGGKLNFYENYEFSEITELWSKIQSKIDSLENSYLAENPQNNINRNPQREYLVVADRFVYEIQHFIELLEDSGELPDDISFILESSGLHDQTHGFFLRPCKTPKNWESPIQSRDIVSSIVDLSENGQASINITLTDDGAKKWGDWTREHIGKTVSIVWENRALSSPKIIQPIMGNVTQISGSFSKEEAKSLATLIPQSNLFLNYSLVKTDIVSAKKAAKK